MDETTPKRWWRKKRWWCVMAVWLVVAYPLSLGPAIYGERRGWMPDVVMSLFLPVLAVQEFPLVGRPYAEYLGWWWDLAPEPQPVFVRPNLPVDDRS